MISGRQSGALASIVFSWLLLGASSARAEQAPAEALAAEASTAQGGTRAASQAPAQAPAAAPGVLSATDGPSGGPAGSADASRLASLLEYHRQQANRYRLYGSVTGLVAAAVTIPTGIVLLNKEEPVAGGIVIGAGAGAALGGLLTAVLPVGPMGGVLSAYEDAQREGLTNQAFVESVERAWKREAEAARLGRQIAAPVLAIVGAAAMGTGVYFSVTDERIGSLSKSDQSAIGAGLLVGGALSLAGMASLACFATPVEASWEEYKRSTGRGLTARIVPRFALSPMPGGAFVAAGLEL